MRKVYYIGNNPMFCFPYGTNEITKNYGAISEYVGKSYMRNEIDKIICELIMRHPYVSGAMQVNIDIRYKYKLEGRTITGYYHHLVFQNEDYQNQKMDFSGEIKYEL